MAPFKNRLNDHFNENGEEAVNPLDKHLYQDINNSACIISGYLEIMQYRDVTLDVQKKYLSLIHREARFINKLLNGYFNPALENE